MSRDGMLFKWAGAIHPVRRTPHRALVAQAVWSSVLVATGTYRALFTRVVYTEWIFFGLMALGLFVLRRRSEVRREYSSWGYPVVPIVFSAAAFAIVVNQIFADPKESLLGLGLVLLGVPVYWIRKRFEEKPA
jgi:APA family basic amino acid/polyamine antiporter